MSTLRRISLVDQTAEHLRQGVRDGRWRVRLPGLRPLADELGVSRHTLRCALARLVDESVLRDGGERKAYLIVSTKVPEVRDAARTLRIAILLCLPVGQLSASVHSVLLRMASSL